MRYSSKGIAKSGVPRANKIVALVAAVLGAAVVAATGVAGVWWTNVSKDTTNLRLRVAHITAGDFDSGWHTHPGLVVVQIQKGSLSYTSASCQTKTYSAGDTFIEVANVPARVVGLGELAFTATFIIGYGDPLQSPSSNPCPA